MKKILLFVLTIHYTVISIHSVSQPCLPEGITFTTQEEIDNFQINYPGCTEIEGSLEISGNDIISLDGLNVISSIGGSLDIAWNDTLHNLTGLENLTNINGGLHLSWVQLNNLNGLEGLTSIGGNFVLNAIGNLQDLTGLENLTSIGGYLRFGTIGTGSSGGTSLISLNGLEGLDSIYGGLGLTANWQLTDISALEGLTYLGGYIAISLNESLAVCQTEWLCDYLLNPNGSVNIQNNAPGCNSIVELGSICNDSLPCLPYGNYYFLTQEDIDNFQSVFPGCTELEGTMFSISSDVIFKSSYSNLSSTIINLNGLNDITSIGGDLFIAYNDSLMNLNGLSSLTSNSGWLAIYDNDLLTTLSGLDNINAGTIYGIEISQNNSLSMCEVQSVCDYLVAPNGIVEIYNNAPDCNSQEEVEAACDELMIGELQVLNKLTISPNPFLQTTTLEFELLEPTNIDLTIYDHLGVVVYNIREQQYQGHQEIKINTENLTSGVYFCTLKTYKGIQTKKIIKLN